MAGAGRSAPGRVTFRVEDPETDRALRNLDDRLRALELTPAAQGVLIKDVDLENGVTMVVYHGLGRAGVSFFVSPPEDGASTSGRIEEMESDSSDITTPDPRNYILLRATGFGVDIVADIWVM